MSNVPEQPDQHLDVLGPPPEIGMLLLGGLLGACITGVLYAGVSLTVPIFLYGGFLYPLLAGAIAGGWVIQIAQWTHVPEGRTAVLCVLGCTLAGWYIHWIVWCAAATDEGLTILPWSLAGVMARAANELPLVLNMMGGTAVVVGAERWFLWGMEAAIILGTAWMVAAMYWPLGRAIGFFTGIFTPRVSDSGSRTNRWEGGSRQHRR